MRDTSIDDAALRAAIERSGYHPQTVADAIGLALAGESVRAHVVHLETTFDSDEVRRHVTVLALTSSRLVVAHTDDHAEAAGAGPSMASTSTESVPLREVRSVVINQTIGEPDRQPRGALPHEVVLTIGWNAITRIDLEPATCGDPTCEADHGYTGTIASDDLSLRVSAAAEGDDAVREMLAFAAELSAATAQVGR